jgi:phenylpropionate dioxygenase-like ring-hydroxylating dioxygenase large terminal subunit
MLSKEQNELLTRVGPDTPMGATLRQFWVPAIRSANLEVDGAPARVRIFGQNYVAFRDSNGRVGFLDEGCPHRGVSLALGRNEECGLRCIFHGWKINVEGQVVDIPSEPAGSNLASKVRVNHYPVREEAGVAWVWLGKGDEPPQFPAFDFVNQPIENMVPRKAIVNCNWVSLLEGLLDSSHVTSLHKDWLPTGKELLSGPNAGMMGALSVTYEIEDRPYGYQANARRRMADGTQVNRKTEYVLPAFCLIPSTLKTLRGVACIVPIDDETTNFWTLTWDTAGPMDAATTDRLRNVGKLGQDPDNIYEPHEGPDKVWGQDREAMKNGSYSGFPALPIEDYAVSSSQGVIANRTAEKLGASDIAIIRMRRLLFDLIKDYQEGRKPKILSGEIDYGKIRPVHEVIAPTGAAIEIKI